jgi:hypothetical protein
VSTSEPFLPFHDTVADHEIDAADPGYGAPGMPPEPEPTPEELEQFEVRLAEKRQHDHLFRIPDPHILQDHDGHGERLSES